MASHKLSFYIFSIILSLILACPDDDLYLIKSGGYTGLVLDGNDTTIRLQHYNGGSSQLWKFETGCRAGNFYVVNNQTKKVLDFEAANTWTLQLTLVGREKEDILRQQWCLDLDGYITNAESRRNVNVAHGNFSAGNRLVLFENNKSLVQKFIVEKFRLVDLLIHPV